MSIRPACLLQSAWKQLLSTSLWALEMDISSDQKLRCRLLLTCPQAGGHTRNDTSHTLTCSHVSTSGQWLVSGWAQM